MKKLLKYSGLVILISGLIFLFACSKSSTENKINGKWKVINIANVNDTLNTETWEFVSDGKLKIWTVTNGQSDSLPECVLKFVVKSYKKLIVQPGDSGATSSYCHDWEILKLKKDVLILDYRSGGLLEKEFVKL
jgi:hypothetical protein